MLPRLPRPSLLLVTSLLLTGASGLVSADDKWVLDRQGDGIKVFTADVAGFNLKAFRATARVKARLDSVVALIADAERFPEWYTDCSENRIVKRLTHKQFINYFVNDSPFPISDRDSIQETTITQDPASRTVKFDLKGMPDFMPLHPDRVRVPRAQGFWLMTPVSDAETDVVFEMRSDAGGSVPAFLANQQVTVGPFKTFVKMRKILTRARYRDATVDYATATVTFGK